MNYHDIKKCDMLNGDGIRVSLWVSGCEHNCSQCQNPQTWTIDSGIPFDEESENELFEALKKPYILGITFSGGDPLHENNLQDVLNLVNKIRLSLPKKNIWLYTGYTWEQIMNSNRTPIEPQNALRQAIILKVDILIDGRYEDDKRDITLKWRGSSNQRVIDVQKSLNEGEVILYEK